MSKIIEDMLREVEEKATEKATEKMMDEKCQYVRNVMRKLKYSAQQAMDLIGIPESEQPKYLAKL